MSTSDTKNLTAGFISGITSAVTLQPFDLLKTRIQQDSNLSLIKIFKNLNSPIELWRGTLPSSIRTSFGSALYFTSLSRIRNFFTSTLKSNKNNSLQSSSLRQISGIANVVSGAFARTFAGLIIMPVTVIKVRYEAIPSSNLSLNNNYNKNPLINCIKSCYNQYGIRGFFKGYGATAARDAPYAGLYLLFYEKLKPIISRVHDDFFINNDNHNQNQNQNQQEKTDSLKFYGHLTSMSINTISGALAAGTATTITNPFDAVKTHIQLDAKKYGGFFNACKVLFIEQGVRGFMAGLGLRLSRKVLSSAIGWCIYEELVRR